MQFAFLHLSQCKLDRRTYMITSKMKMKPRNTTEVSQAEFASTTKFSPTTAIRAEDIRTQSTPARTTVEHKLRMRIKTCKYVWLRAIGTSKKINWCSTSWCSTMYMMVQHDPTSVLSKSECFSLS